VGGMMRIIFLSILFLAYLSIAAFLYGCGNDDKLVNGSNVQPEYHLVVDIFPDDSNHTDSHYFLSVNTRSDSVIDSISVPFGEFGIGFNGDGSAACFSKIYPDPGFTWVTAWPNIDTIAYKEGMAGKRVYFSQDNQYLLVSGGTSTLYSFPGMAGVYVDTTGASGIFIPGEKKICAYKWLIDTLDFIDYDEIPPARYSFPLRGKAGEALYVSAVCASLSGDSLILATEKFGQDGGHFIAVVTTDSLKIIDQVAVDAPLIYTELLLRPEGDEVFFNYEGTTWPDDVYGTVYAYNISSKEIKIIADESDIGRFFPSEMAVTPDGKHLYILGSYEKDLIKIRLSDGSMSRPISQLEILGYSIAINPAEQGASGDE